jgi:hypothetical protein
MQLKLVSVILALAATISAVVVPDDLPDGAYGVDIDSEGNPQFTRLDIPLSWETRDVQQRSELVERSFYAKHSRRDENGCTEHSFDVHQDYTDAQNCMIDIANAGGQAGGHAIITCVRGEAILALCNYSGNSQGPVVNKTQQL